MVLFIQFQLPNQAKQPSLLPLGTLDHRPTLDQHPSQPALSLTVSRPQQTLPTQERSTPLSLIRLSARVCLHFTVSFLILRHPLSSPCGHPPCLPPGRPNRVCKRRRQRRQRPKFPSSPRLNKTERRETMDVLDPVRPGPRSPMPHSSIMPEEAASSLAPRAFAVVMGGGKLATVTPPAEVLEFSTRMRVVGSR